MRFTRLTGWPGRSGRQPRTSDSAAPGTAQPHHSLPTALYPTTSPTTTFNMTWSNEYIASSVIASTSSAEPCPACRPRCPSAPVSPQSQPTRLSLHSKLTGLVCALQLLAQRLPPYAHIQSSAARTAQQTRRTHVMTSELESALDDSIPAYPPPPDSVPSTVNKQSGKKDREFQSGNPWSHDRASAEPCVALLRDGRCAPAGVRRAQTPETI